MSTVERSPAHVRWTLGLEEATTLDPAVKAIEPVVRSAFGMGARGSLLRGDWLGHAVHPMLTDVVLGTWTSATILDLVGGRDSRQASQRLIGAGLLAWGPTAWTGWAEWSVVGTREKRVGLVHGVTNGIALTVYTASWLARRRGRHDTGARLALAGAALTGVAGYLGGHLAAARKVGSHHPAFDSAATSTSL